MKAKFSKFKAIDKIRRFRGIFPTRLNKIRLDANERVSSFQLKFIKNIKKKINSDHFTAYPEIEKIYDLLSQKYKLNRLNFLIASGSDSGIRHCFELFTKPNSKIITLTPTFGMYDVYAKTFQTKQVKISYDKKLKLNTALLFKNLRKDVSMVMIANPNSPTGTIIEHKKLIDIIIKAKQCNCYVVINEAYFGFYKKTLLPLVKKYNNLVILRTFSKAIGMAGIRAGFIVSNKKTIKRLYAFRPMYEISSIAAVVVEQIIKKDKITNNYIKETLEGKKYLIKEISKQGLNYYKTYSNFMLVDFKNKKTVNKIYKNLLNSKILIRKAPNIAACKTCLRFTLGPVSYMKILANNIKKQLKN